jgi:hypothetical protein
MTDTPAKQFAATIYWLFPRIATPVPMTIEESPDVEVVAMSKNRTKSEAPMLARLHRDMERPGQGPDTGPYWTVQNLSRHKDLRFQPPAFPFRHPTEEAARAEAERLAALPKHAGWRFGVFAYTGFSAKIQAPQPPNAEAARAEAPEMATTEN